MEAIEAAVQALDVDCEEPPKPPPIPEIILTEVSVAPSEIKEAFRGPILRIRSNCSEITMNYSKSEELRFLSNPWAHDEPYFFDENHQFSITPKCKDTKYISLKNEGTTAIRFQWFHYPPNHEAVKMLEDLSKHKSLRLGSGQPGLGGDELQQENAHHVEYQFRVQKRASLDFHFSELPTMILPGQIIDCPIIFRGTAPGYYSETLYLLTHPRLLNPEGKYYAVRLTGVCALVELAERGNEMHEIECLKRYLNEKCLEGEASELMDSILDRAIWESDNSGGICCPDVGLTCCNFTCQSRKADRDSELESPSMLLNNPEE